MASTTANPQIYRNTGSTPHDFTYILFLIQFHLHFTRQIESIGGGGNGEGRDGEKLHVLAECAARWRHGDRLGRHINHHRHFHGVNGDQTGRRLRGRGRRLGRWSWRRSHRRRRRWRRWRRWRRSWRRRRPQERTPEESAFLLHFATFIGLRLKFIIQITCKWAPNHM